MSSRNVVADIPDDVRIHEKKVRHPMRMLAAVILLLAVVGIIVDGAGREAYDWAAFGTYIFDPRIVQAAGVTIQLTVYSMIIAITLGVLLAVMRQSPNKILGYISWVFIWIFRGTPVYVQLVFWGLFTVIYKTINVGVPGMEPWWSFGTADVLSLFWIAVIGLALNEAAYMAEIVRAGLLAVDSGQVEAATALGMNWRRTMGKVVLPQAMRVIIPPTGNEVISMLKTTSLLSVIAVLELYTQASIISSSNLKQVELLIVVSAWYLFMTSMLSIPQYYLERRFGRGTTRNLPPTPFQRLKAAVNNRKPGPEPAPATTITQVVGE